MNPYSVIFDQNNINMPGVKVLSHEFNNLPDRDIKINKLARRDLSIISSAEYSQKQITVIAEVCGGTRAETEATLALLKQILQPVSGQLKVEQNGYEVAYTATMNEFNIEWQGTSSIVTIEFIASDPLGKTVELLTFANFTHTDGQTFETSEFIGSGTIEPVINIILTSKTGTGDQTINVFNARTNQGITLTRTWTDGDIIIIDSSEKRVTINGALSDFTGILPTWSAGTQQIGVTDTLTTRSADVAVSYKATFS